MPSSAGSSTGSSDGGGGGGSARTDAEVEALARGQIADWAEEGQTQPTSAASWAADGEDAPSDLPDLGDAGDVLQVNSAGDDSEWAQRPVVGSDTSDHLPAASSALFDARVLGVTSAGVFHVRHHHVAQVAATITSSDFVAVEYRGAFDHQPDIELDEWYYNSHNHHFWRKRSVQFTEYWEQHAYPANWIGYFADADAAASAASAQGQVYYDADLGRVRTVNTYAAGTDADDVYSWEPAAGFGQSAATIRALAGGLPEATSADNDKVVQVSSDGSYELSDLPDAPDVPDVTDDALSISAPSGESTEDAPSRQSVAEAIAGASVGSTLPPTNIYSSTAGTTVVGESAPQAITVTADPDDFEVLVFDVEPRRAVRTLAMAHRDGTAWLGGDDSADPSSAGTVGFSVTDTGNSGIYQVWSTGATNVTVDGWEGVSSSDWIVIRNIWGYASIDDYLGPVLPAEVTEDEAEAGTETSARLWSPQRVAQAIAGLETGAQEVEPSSSDINRTLLLFRGFTGEPQIGVDYPTHTWANDGWDTTPNGPFYTTYGDAYNNRPAGGTVWMFIAHTQRRSSVWTQGTWTAVSLGLPTQYSADGETSWHAVQADADNFLRYRTGLGTWSAPVALGATSPLEWHEIGNFNLNNNTLANITITPFTLADFTELRVRFRRFTSWTNYSNGAWNWQREFVIPTDGIPIATLTNTTAYIIGSNSLPIGCRCSQDDAMIGLGYVLMTDGNTTTHQNFSFAFRGEDGQVQSIQVCEKSANWMWGHVTLFVR